jgi:mannan endo-1,4-beta-mannosidase
MSECGSFPDADNLVKDGAAWSWFMPWYGSFVRDAKNNSLALWQKTMSHEYVITLDEMPDLKTYEAAVQEPEPEPDPILSTEQTDISGANIFPTFVKDRLYIESKSDIGQVSVYNSLGIEVHSSFEKSNKAVILFSNEMTGIFYVKIRNQAAVKVFKE